MASPPLLRNQQTRKTQLSKLRQLNASLFSDSQVNISLNHPKTFKLANLLKDQSSHSILHSLGPHLNQPSVSRNLPSSVTRYTQQQITSPNHGGVPFNIGKTMPITQRSINLKGSNGINKSFNFDRQEQSFNKVEHQAQNGCSGVYACGPLSRQRYINLKLEKELFDFKKEVEGKFKQSSIANFVFPRQSLPNQLSSVEKDNNTLIIEEDEGKQQQFKNGLKSGRKILDHKTFMNYPTEGPTRNEISTNLSINYDNSYDTNKTIPAQKNTQKYDQSLDQILKQSGMLNRNLTYKKMGKVQIDTTRFKENNTHLKMPQLPPQSFIKYQDKDIKDIQDRFSKLKTPRIVQNITTTNNTTNNFININNSQLYIQSPQNNTIILVDSQINENNSRSFIHQNENQGIVRQKLDQVNKSFQGDMGGISSFRNLQQSRIFDQYLKQNIVTNKNHKQQNNTSRNNVNLIHRHSKNKLKYDTNRSTVRREIHQEHQSVSKSFIFPPSKLSKKNL